MVISGHKFYHIFNNNVSTYLNTLKSVVIFSVRFVSRKINNFLPNTICKTLCFYAELTKELVMTSSTYTVWDNAITIVLRNVR